MRPSPHHRRARSLTRLGASLIAVASLAVLATGCVPQLFQVEGHAMAPTLKHDDRVVFTRVVGTPVRGDVVALRYPVNPTKSFVMRIVGLPGERLSIVGGVVHIDGRMLPEPYVATANRTREAFGPVTIAPHAYFVMGDNRGNASDSRQWGTVPRDHIWAKWAWW